MMKLPNLDYFGYEDTLKPQEDDLKRLYNHIIDNHCFTVLEFGCGYSTIAMSQALQENKKRWDALKKKPKVRNSNMFKIFSVDTDYGWLNHVFDKIPKELQKSADITHSDSHAREYNGQVCHAYSIIPNVVPDFIYLDGPDPKEVKGNINGISWKCKERTPMAADILLMEPTLLPATTIIVDGRTNNARFLKRNLKRKWNIYEETENDITSFYLDERRLGKINVLGIDTQR